MIDPEEAEFSYMLRGPGGMHVGLDSEDGRPYIWHSFLDLDLHFHCTSTWFLFDGYDIVCLRHDFRVQEGLSDEDILGLCDTHLCYTWPVSAFRSLCIAIDDIVDLRLSSAATETIEELVGFDLWRALPHAMFFDDGHTDPIAERFGIPEAECWTDLHSLVLADDQDAAMVRLAVPEAFYIDLRAVIDVPPIYRKPIP